MISDKLSMLIDLEIRVWKPDQFLDLDFSVDNIVRYRIRDGQGKQKILIHNPELRPGTQHELIMYIRGKTKSYTDVDEDGSIKNDVLVSIKNIEFNEIPLGSLISKYCSYEPEYRRTNKPVFDHNTINLGFNGQWHLKFETPAYLWMFKNT
jgi:hypothetical protein